MRLRCADDELRQQQRQFDVLLRGERRHQVVELEHEADVVAAPVRQLARARAGRCAGRRPRSRRRDGVSRPPMRFSSVVLPEPDGPISATKSPFVDVQVEAVQDVDGLRAAAVGLVQVADADERGHANSGAAVVRIGTLLRLRLLDA